MSDNSKTDSNKLGGLFKFAEELLSARTKTRLRVDSEKLGCFREQELVSIPGLTVSSADKYVAESTWLQLVRLNMGKPPLPDEVAELSQWLDKDTVKSPEAKPGLLETRVFKSTLGEAKTYLEHGALKFENIEFIETVEISESYDAQETLVFIHSDELETGSVVDSKTDAESELDKPDETKVKITLHISGSPGVKEEFNYWKSSVWDPWAKAEIPIRQSISLYKKLFKLHSVLHTGDSSANEIVWGIGMAEFGKQSSSKRIDIPLIEFLLDIDLLADGTITLIPRDVAPQLNLRPLMEAGLDGADHAQPKLQSRFQELKESDEFELTPFLTDELDLYFTGLTSQISSDASYIDRVEFDKAFANEGIPTRDPDRLRVHAGWVIYGRPRSNDIRVEDMRLLREHLDTVDDAALPESLGGFVQPLPDADEDADDIKLPSEYPADWGDYVSQKHKENHIRYYFPLASNEDQNQIISQLEKHAVVTVTGPPGTGKTHSIANILAHYMVTGKRVLVTARTAEAISAVQSKLPEELASLVIASVSSDKEGARQLESAIQRLSDEVVDSNERQLQHEVTEANNAIDKAEEGILECETKLARISQQNLTPLKWQGERTTVMELAQQLESQSDSYSWFLDRPQILPTEAVIEAVGRIKYLLESQRTLTGYAFVEIPTPDELPTTKALLEYHQEQVKLAAAPKEDFTNEPPMAVDTPDAKEHARELEQYFVRTAEQLSRTAPWKFALCKEIVSSKLLGTGSDISATILKLASLTGGAEPRNVSIDYRSVDQDELLSKLKDRVQGGKGSLLGQLFKNKSVMVLNDATIDGKTIESQREWREVRDWIELDKKASEIRSLWKPLADVDALPQIPRDTHELASEINRMNQTLDKASKPLTNLVSTVSEFEGLFPHGINAKQHFANLELDRLGRAIRANINRAPAISNVEMVLTDLKGRGSLPLFQKCGHLLGILQESDVDSAAAMKVRNELTAELEQIQSVEPQLKQLHVDLDTLQLADVPKFAELIKQTCLNSACGDAADLSTTNWEKDWQLAWEWASSKRELDEVLALGNGDQLREKKQQYINERQKHFLSLMQAKTRIELKKRITPTVRSEFMRFTQAIGKLGAGTGKTAHRHRKTIKEAARNASPAVPVWIMPESKVSEQMPAALGSFDLVILDEASQSDITSLGVLARGAKLLIVGDEKQVSPSSVGVTIDRVDQLRAEYLQAVPSRSSYDEKTSIFDIAMQRYPQSHLMLKEHFRCVHPIIHFSTRFYEGRLVPLRVPKASERFDPPLVDVHIKGASRNGKINEAEARYIVEEIVEITSKPEHSDRDIAVISLIGAEQAEHIERLLMDDARVGPEVIERHHIVCGDSRTMQGQERSIVFLSMVADSATARVQRTREDRQRFNVAASRARDREYVVRSVASADLKPDDLKSELIQHFNDPLPEGRVIVGQDVLSRCDSGFERDVCQMLLDAGYRVRSQVAAGYYRIDLVVEGDNDSRLAIELDGDHWHGPERWESDMARQASLERAGWHFWRVFGSQWYNNKEHYWGSLLDALKAEGIEPIGGEAVEGNFTEHLELDASELLNLSTGDGDTEIDEVVDGAVQVIGESLPSNVVDISLDQWEKKKSN